MLPLISGYVTKLSAPLLKFALLGLAVAALLGYHYYTVSTLTQQLNTQRLATEQVQTALTQAHANIQTLTTAHEAAQQSLTVARQNLDTAAAELKRTREQDAQSAATLHALQAKLADQRRQEREKALREGSRAELLLSVYNRNVTCTIDNFARPGGHCVAGIWKPNK